VCFTAAGELVATDNVDTGDRVKMYSGDVGGGGGGVGGGGGMLRKLSSSIIVRPWAACYDDYSSSIIITDHGHSPLKIIKPSLSTNDISMLRCELLNE